MLCRLLQSLSKSAQDFEGLWEGLEGVLGVWGGFGLKPLETPETPENGPKSLLASWGEKMALFRGFAKNPKNPQRKSQYKIVPGPLFIFKPPPQRRLNMCRNSPGCIV